MIDFTIHEDVIEHENDKCHVVAPVSTLLTTSVPLDKLQSEGK